PPERTLLILPSLFLPVFPATGTALPRPNLGKVASQIGPASPLRALAARSVGSRAPVINLSFRPTERARVFTVARRRKIVPKKCLVGRDKEGARVARGPFRGAMCLAGPRPCRS